MSRKADSIMANYSDSDDQPDEIDLEPALAPAGTHAPASVSHVKETGLAGIVGRVRHWFVTANQFVRYDVPSELRRVSWPSLEDVRTTTLIVVVNVLFFTVFLFGVDQAWGYLLRGFLWLLDKIPH